MGCASAEDYRDRPHRLERARPAERLPVAHRRTEYQASRRDAPNRLDSARRAKTPAGPMYSPPQSPPQSPPRTYTASLGDRDYDEERKDDSLRSDPSSVISTASTMATPAKLEAGDRVLGTYGDETRRAVVRDVDATGEKIVVEFSPTPRSASQVSSMFARDVSFVSRPAKPHALAHLLPPKLGDALGRTVELSEAFRDAEAIGIYIVDQARPSAAATERLANLRRWVGGRKFGVALYELSSQMPGDVDMTLKAKGGHRVLLGDDANVLVVDAPETVIQNWNLFEVCSVRQLPALVVVSPSAEVFTRDGVEALCSTAEFPWRGYQSPQTKRLEFKRKAIHACSLGVAGLLALLGAYRVLSFALSALGALVTTASA